MAVEKRYVLDANVFIEAHRAFYSFDLCPGFWDCLEWHHGKGRVCSIDRVKTEIEKGNDQLTNWSKSLPTSCFDTTDDEDIQLAYADMQMWAQGHETFTSIAKRDFATTADAWISAYAKSKKAVVVTRERFNLEIKKRVPIPNVCREFGVECIDTFQMLQSLNARFEWVKPLPD